MNFGQPVPVGMSSPKVEDPWTPKLTYTFYPFSWKRRIFW